MSSKQLLQLIEGKIIRISLPLPKEKTERPLPTRRLLLQRHWSRWISHYHCPKQRQNVPYQHGGYGFNSVGAWLGPSSWMGLYNWEIHFRSGHRCSCSNNSSYSSSKAYWTLSQDHQGPYCHCPKRRHNVPYQHGDYGFNGVGARMDASQGTCSGHRSSWSNRSSSSSSKSY